MNSLLPPNTTVLERNVSDVSAKATDLNVDIKKLVKPATIPSQFLSQIAWQNSVDRWQRDWSDKSKRAQIKASFNVHQKQGTISALRSIVEGFGYSLLVTEWWQEEPNNTPGTFQITIDTEGNELSEQGYNTLVALLNDAKPLTRELKGIELNVVSVRGDTNIGCGMYDGDDVTIYPKQDESIPFLYPIFAHYGHDETTVYPRA